MKPTLRAAGALIFSCAATAFALRPAAAQTITYVVPGGTGLGTSWADATGDLADAMSTAAAGTEVWVAQGTYYPTVCAAACTDAERLATFDLRPDVAVIGGFTGTETLRAQASPSNATVLSGRIGASGAADNAYGVVRCDNCGDQAELVNFVVEGGRADRAAAGGPGERGRAGAGLYLMASGGVASPRVTACTFRLNEASGRGGALFGNGSPGVTAPLLTDCRFELNAANGEGGACAFAADGGQASPTFVRTDFVSNATAYAPGVSQAGGALYVVVPGGTAQVTLSRCLFQDNVADANASGGINNNTSGNGGAVYATAGSTGALTLLVDNTLFDRNAAFSGGAVYLLGGSIDARSTTVTDNLATGNGGSGGGIYLNDASATLVNHLSYGNASTTNAFGGGDLRFVNGTADVSYALFGAATQGELFSRGSTANADVLNLGAGVILGQDPLLDRALGYPQIASATSPAVDAGLTSAAPPSNVDYGGGQRVVAGAIDLGAAESAFVPLPVQLVDFAATPRSGSIRLRWTTSHEEDLAGYALLRSRNGADFEEISFVPAMGLGEYAYDDRAAVAGVTYYYRLVSADLDGTTYASDVVAAAIDDGVRGDVPLAVSLYPNPSRGRLTVEIAPDHDRARTVYASVLDARGARLRLFPLTTDGAHELDLGDLPAGNYVVRLRAGDRAQTEPFVLTH